MTSIGDSGNEEYKLFFQTNENPIQRELLQSKKAQTQYVKAETEYTQVLKEAQLQRIQNMQTGMIVTVVFFVIIVLILIAMLIFLIIASTKGNCTLGGSLNTSNSSNITDLTLSENNNQKEIQDILLDQTPNPTEPIPDIGTNNKFKNTPYPRFQVSETE